MTMRASLLGLTVADAADIANTANVTLLFGSLGLDNIRVQRLDSTCLHCCYN